MQFVAAGEAIPPLATFLGLEALAATAARHGAGTSNYMSEKRLRSGRVYVTPTKRAKTMAPSMGPTHLGGGTVGQARKGRFHSQLGRRPGAYATRRHTYNATGSTNKVDKEPAIARLIKIPWSEDETLINKRRGQLVNVKGVKIDHFWVMRPNPAANESTAWPLQVRWAVVNPKNNDGGSSLSTADFFINKDPLSEMSKDFPSTGSYFEFMARKINRQQFDVLAEGNFIIKQDNQQSQTVTTSPAELTYRVTYSRLYHRLRLWIPINKQMKFADNTVETPETNIYLVWWFVAYGDDRNERIFTTADTPVKHFGENSVYFSNSAMFR